MSYDSISDRDPRKRLFTNPPPGEYDTAQTAAKRERNERLSSKILLVDVPAHIDEMALKTIFLDFVSAPKVYVVMREDFDDKHRVAYVDMGSGELARQWMQTFEGRLALPDKTTIYADPVRPLMDVQNWTCSGCSSTEDGSKTICDKCSMLREESEDMNLRGATLIGTTPNDTLLLRCLPKGINGPRIAEGLSRVARLLQIVHIHLGKSRRFAFVQMSSQDDAEMLFACFRQAPLVLDECKIAISFCRMSFTEWKAQQNRPLVQLQPELLRPIVPAVPIPEVRPISAASQISSVAQAPPTTPAEIAEHARLLAQQRRMEVASIVQQAMGTNVAPVQTTAPMVQVNNASTMNTGYVQGTTTYSIPAIPDLSKPPPMVGQPVQQTFGGPPQGFNIDLSRPPPGIIIQGPMGNLPYGTPIILAGGFPQTNGPIIIQQPGIGMPTTQSFPSTSIQPGFSIVSTQGLPIMQTSGIVTQTMTTVHNPPANIPPIAPPGGVIGEIDTPVGTFPQYVTPNPSTFVDETTSGYKVDLVTMFYYDPKTNYYYSNSMKKWCSWEPMYATYIPIDKKAEIALAAQTRSEQSISQKGDSPVNEDSKRTGQDIAREMMKWARRQEKEKSKISLSLRKEDSSLPSAATSNNLLSGRDISLRLIEKMQNPLKHPDLDSSDDEINPSTSNGGYRRERRRTSAEEQSRRSPSPIRQERSGPSAQEQREEMERSLIDRSSKTCLLCRRAFPSVDVLDKHVERSDLHRTNLEAKRVEWGKAYVARMMASLDGA